eukprot:160264_1
MGTCLSDNIQLSNDIVSAIQQCNTLFEQKKTNATNVSRVTVTSNNNPQNINTINIRNDLSNVIFKHPIQSGTHDVKHDEFQIDWLWLKHKYPLQYLRRKQLVENRTHEKLLAIGACTVPIEGNGNCIINSYLYHIEKMSTENAFRERAKMMSFMQQNINEYKTVIDNFDEHIKNYSKNHTYLDEIHVKVLHEMNRINILLFEYHINTDSLSQHYYYNAEYTSNKCLFLVYYRHSQHYNYCIVNNEYHLPSEAGHHYHQNGDKYHILQQFDQALLNNLYAKALGLYVEPPNMFSEDSIVQSFVRHKRFKQIRKAKKKVTATQNGKKHIYSYGYKFEYGYCGEMKHQGCIKVVPHYSSLKEEVISAGLSPYQFCNEYGKAEMHYNSYFRRKTYPDLSVESVIALSLHCNFTSLNYLLGISMRENGGIEHKKFYYWAKCLKEAVHKHGTRIKDGMIKQFYHGVDKQFVFPSYVNSVEINCPLSTSSSFAVACSFASNEGLIIQFKDDIGYNRYFSVGWLSDYGAEQEYLFIQNEYAFKIANIIQACNGVEYDLILTALGFVHDMMTYRNSAAKSCCTIKQLAERLIQHRLPSSFPEYKPFNSLNSYGLDVTSTYFMSVKSIEIDLALFMKGEYEYFFDLLFKRYYIDSNELNIVSAKMVNINAIFPNIQSIIIHYHVPLSFVAVRAVCNDLTENIKSIKLIGVLEEDINELISNFQQNYRLNSQFEIFVENEMDNCEKCLCIRRTNCNISAPLPVHYNSKHAQLSKYFEK